MAKIKTIGILTSGGDAPGMNDSPVHHGERQWYHQPWRYNP